MAVRHEEGTERRLIWVVAVLGVAVLGLVGWVAYDAFAPTAPNGELQELVDAYHQAWNDHDGEAFLALVTDDYVMETAQGGPNDAIAQAANVVEMAESDWTVVVIGEPLWWEGTDDAYYVSFANRLTSTVYPEEGYEGMSMLKIVEVDDTYLVARHIYYGRY